MGTLLHALPLGPCSAGKRLISNRSSSFKILGSAETNRAVCGPGEAQPCKGPLTVGVWLGRVDHAVEQAAVPVLLQVPHLQESTPECPSPPQPASYGWGFHWNANKIKAFKYDLTEMNPRRPRSSCLSRRKGYRGPSHTFPNLISDPCALEGLKLLVTLVTF